MKLASSILLSIWLSLHVAVEIGNIYNVILPLVDTFKIARSAPFVPLLQLPGFLVPKEKGHMQLVTAWPTAPVTRDPWRHSAQAPPTCHSLKVTASVLEGLALEEMLSRSTAALCNTHSQQVPDTVWKELLS